MQATTTTTTTKRRRELSDADRAMAARAQAWIEATWRANPTLPEIAKAVHLSPFHFHRLFTAATGTTPKYAVDVLRIEEAKRRLLAGDEITAIALELGFAHQSHFTSRFKAYVGVTPGAWRKQMRRAQVAAEVAAEVAAKSADGRKVA
jgi:AraC-like DNA-binding protein